MQRNLIKKSKLFEKLKAKLREMIILVEGKRDKEAIIRAGIGHASNIIIINSRRMESVIDGMQGMKVAVMTDYDRTGNTKAKEAFDELLSRNAKPDMECRRELRRILGLRRIEEIGTSIRDFEERLAMIRELPRKGMQNK
ncbi:MAG: hypothetical protein QW112_02130 [Candidatus Micrarchaeia archaeon]